MVDLPLSLPTTLPPPPLLADGYQDAREVMILVSRGVGV
jgi:hypothetical protein